MKKKKLKLLKKNLSKKVDILGRRNLLNSAVLIPLIKIKKEYYLLFQKRAAHIRQGGDICFPGGRFEKGVDKSFKHTALRETQEELGIDKKDMKVIGKLGSYVAPIGAIVEPYVAVVKKKAYKNMVIDKNEVEDAFLIPLSFFKKNQPLEYTLAHEVHPYKIDEDGKKEIFFPVEDLGLPKTYHKPWGNKKHKVWVYKHNDDVIWGITSVIINELIEKY